MRIYIETPLFNRSNAVPHMVEHCVGHSILQFADFFDYMYGAEKMNYAEYTTCDYDDRIHYEDAIVKLTTSLNEASFRYEKKVLQEEISDPSYGQRIYERLVQQIVHPTILRNTAKFLFRKDVVAYHKKRYQPEHMVVIDDDYKVLYQGLKTPIPKKQTPKYFSFPFTFEKDQYFVIGAKHCDKDIYWELFFLFQILYSYGVYQLRWKQRQYYLNTYFHTFEHVNWVVFPRIDVTSLDQSFFEQGKKYILQMFAQGYFKEKFFLNHYFYAIPASREMVIEKYQKY